MNDIVMRSILSGQASLEFVGMRFPVVGYERERDVLLVAVWDDIVRIPMAEVVEMIGGGDEAQTTKAG